MFFINLIAKKGSLTVCSFLFACVTMISLRLSRLSARYAVLLLFMDGDAKKVNFLLIFSIYLLYNSFTLLYNYSCKEVSATARRAEVLVHLSVEDPR